MNSDQLEVLIIVVLILAFAGMSLFAMYLDGQIQQWKGYAKRLERDGYRVLRTRE
jgi:preprotein translocase subunit SecY